ncbi:MAG: FHA domain-containing protein [Chloroflexi bacterium]|nr:FHA domain-containing protein [Chloroflexota bacterium]
MQKREKSNQLASFLNQLFPVGDWRLAIGDWKISNLQSPISQSLKVLILFILLFTAVPLHAQDDPPPSVERLIITGTSVESLPTIELRIYGRDAQGNPLDLSRQSLDILHGGNPVGPITYQGAHRTGALTIFLIDIPTGVQGQLPALQEAVNQYASPGNMMEQVDYVAIYQVGLSEAQELLTPTNFHNAVRNLFADPLSPETGATALYDSTVDLLDRVNSLTPNAEMPVSIVLMTDGTDSVSTRHTAAGVSQRAAELGIPIHTVWLDNTDLGSPVGQPYLTELAAQTGGVAVQLDSAADMPLVWNRIAGFRDQARIRYQVNGLTGGAFPVEVSMADNAAIKDETEVNIPFNIPSVQIDLPPESRTLSLSNLEDGTRLRFKTQVSWLDEEKREIEAAQLVVNGDTAVPYEIPVSSLDNFVAEVSNLTYGNNTVEVVVLDSQGMRATSPTIILTVNEGRTDIPAELRGSSAIGQMLLRLLLILAVGAALAGLLFFLWQKGHLSRLGNIRIGGFGRRPRRGAEPGLTIEEADAPVASPTTVVMGYLDVLSSISRMESSIPLQGTLVRIGRSPTQCEIAFENDITVSRAHANLQLEGNDYRIFDENSTSGSFVNERQVPEYGIQLLDGDEIHLGAVHLRYRRS